jgi:hypothetical protein
MYGIGESAGMAYGAGEFGPNILLSHSPHVKAKNVLLVAVLVATSSVFLWQFVGSRPSMERSIRRLNSDDFHTIRIAQWEIVAHGPSALPRLCRAVLTGTNEFESELCCYLIGDIDPKAYGNILSEATKQGRTGIAHRYPNWDAVDALPAAEQQRVLSEFAKSGVEIPDYERAKLNVPASQ